ncbi:unnamed protein product [Lactuca virosa]|uniref:F-box associated beta-propeller type 1 domain-containing protein n=1 Tax=Lactuca virosa TaxID=75947 RepID=A0AAU9PHB0_9ASTR|nr:unnamed protein product [Lactuca virosa]
MMIQQTKPLPDFYEARSRLILEETRKANNAAQSATTDATALNTQTSYNTRPTYQVQDSNSNININRGRGRGRGGRGRGRGRRGGGNFGVGRGQQQPLWPSPYTQQWSTSHSLSPFSQPWAAPYSWPPTHTPPCPYPTNQPRSTASGLLGPRPSTQQAYATSENSYTPTNLEQAFHTMSLHPPDQNCSPTGTTPTSPPPHPATPPALSRLPKPPIQFTYIRRPKQHGHSDATETTNTTEPIPETTNTIETTNTTKPIITSNIPTRTIKTRSMSEISKPKCNLNLHASTLISPIPKNPTEALNNLDWKNPMLDEFRAIIDNKTWELVPRHPHMNIVRNRGSATDVRFTPSLVYTKSGLHSHTTPSKFYTIDCERPKEGISAGRPLPFKVGPGESIRILTSVHGVVCIGIYKVQCGAYRYNNIDKYSDLILWNPATSDHKTLSRPSHCSHPDCYMITDQSLFGLYYSSWDDDYKLLRVTPHPDVYIYSLKSDSWRKVKSDFQRTGVRQECLSYFWGPNVSLNENIYFLEYNVEESYSVMSFNTKTETFKSITTPFWGNQKITWLIFTVLRDGCIHLWVNIEKSFRLYENELWRMNRDGDWTKVQNSGTILSEPLWNGHGLHLMRN